MQERHHDGTVGPVESFDERKMQAALDDQIVKEVRIFRRESKADKEARIEWNKLSRNQKRRIRRRLLERDRWPCIHGPDCDGRGLGCGPDQNHTRSES